jgi:hypothetical protein
MSLLVTFFAASLEMSGIIRLSLAVEAVGGVGM